MRRLHVHLDVRDLDASIRFYSALFGAEPDRREADYARWRLEEPALNLAVSTGEGARGLDHLGLDLESEADRRALAARLEAAGYALLEQRDAHCCYARGDKSWARDPEGVAWEAFHTTARSAERGADAPPDAAEPAPEERASSDEGSAGSAAGAAVCC